MGSWWVVFKKDMRMSRTMQLIGLGIMLVLGAWLVFLSYTAPKHALDVAAVLVMCFVLLVFYLPLYLLNTLRREWRNSSSLWFHFPHNGWALLFAKFLSGIVYMVAYLLLIYVFGLWSLHILVDHIVPGMTVSSQFATSGSIAKAMNIVNLAFTGILGMSIYLGTWLMFILISMQATKHSLRKLRVLLGFALFLIPTWGMGAFQSTTLFMHLTHWGRMYIPTATFHTNATHVHADGGYIYAGIVVFYAIVIALVFAISGWLLEKKMEV